MKKEKKIFCITKNKYFYFIKILRCNKGNDVYKSQEAYKSFSKRRVNCYIERKD